MSFPDDPWTLLELDRAVAGEREVKRAYARLLKQHRPDSDPEGFRRVNAAYQAALAELSQGPRAAPTLAEPEQVAFLEDPAVPEAVRLFDAALDGAEPEAMTGPEAVSSPRREVDPAVLGPFEAIGENLLKRLALVSSSGDLPEFTRLRNLVRQHPELADRWVELLLKLVEGPALHQVVTGLHAEDVWLLMREGQGQFAAGVMLQWKENATLLGRFNQLGNLLLGQPSGDDPDRLQAMHFTARTAAFYLPEVSGRLADELYRQTGPGVRDQIVREIELRSSAGKLFAQCGLPLKQFWEYRLFEADDAVPADWNQPLPQAALKDVAATCPAEWEGWAVVTQMVPEDVLRPILAQRRQQQPRPVYQTELVPDRSWFGGGGRWMWVAVILVLKGIFLSVNSNKLPPASSYRDSQLQEQVERLKMRESWITEKTPASEAQRRLDEYRKASAKEKGTAEPSLPGSPLPPGANVNLQDLNSSFGTRESLDRQKLRYDPPAGSASGTGLRY